MVAVRGCSTTCLSVLISTIDAFASKEDGVAVVVAAVVVAVVFDEEEGG